MCTICSSLDQVLASQAAGAALPDPTGLAGFTAVREAVVTADVNAGADAAGNTGTSYSIDVGEVFAGEIGSGSDSDWIAVDLMSQGITFEKGGIYHVAGLIY